MPADSLGDIKTTKNKLSVFEVADEGQSRRVVAALALDRALKMRDDAPVRDMSGMFFTHDVLEALGVQLERKPGATRDSGVNEWHLNLIELSGAQLVDFARHLLLNVTPRLFTATELVAELKSSRDGGRIEIPKELPSRVKQQLES